MMKKDKSGEGISTFLGPDAAIEGTIVFQGSMRLDGKVRGDITSDDGTLIVGENGQIEAAVTVDIVIVKGALTGTIQARDRIELHPPARVTGDIAAPVVAIAAGVFFNGKCTMTAAAAGAGEKAGAHAAGNARSGEEPKERM
jgi:cytoskeletal protein CcmA (bactofilin family)